MNHCLKSLFVSAMSLCVVFSAFGQTPAGEQKNTVEIHLSKEDTGRDRSIVFVPITGFYDSSTDLVRLDFHENMGNAVITVTATQTGYSVMESTDSAEGHAIIQLDGCPGHYQIMIETSYGGTYVGEFQVLGE